MAKNRRVENLEAISFNLGSARSYLDNYEQYHDGRPEGAPYFRWAGEAIGRAAKLGGDVSELAKRLRRLQTLHERKIDMRYNQIAGDDNPLIRPRAA